MQNAVLDKSAIGRVASSVSSLGAAAGVVESYLYLDPKAAAGVEPPHLHGAFREALVYFVGGGSYAEHHALAASASAKGRSVIYGATEMLSPSQLLQQIETLCGETLPTSAATTPTRRAAKSS